MALTGSGQQGIYVLCLCFLFFCLIVVSYNIFQNKHAIIFPVTSTIYDKKT